jgi:transcriptional antiterminator
MCVTDTIRHKHNETLCEKTFEFMLMLFYCSSYFTKNGSGVFHLNYKVIKAINNNVVLAQEPDTQDQIILIAKGIGFNRKPGNMVSDNLNGKEVIKFLNGANNANKINGRLYGKNEISTVVQSIAKSAEKKLSIHNKGFYPALLDHICFAIDRIQFGVPIENPFINEISVLYRDEYKEAQNAVMTIKKELGISLGNDEAGFIALHFHSAKKDTPVSASLKNVRILNKVMEELFPSNKRLLSENSDAVRAFFLTVSDIADYSTEGHSLKMPRECRISEAFPESRSMAVKIKEIIRKETGNVLSCGDMDFLTVGIEQLRQQFHDIDSVTGSSPKICNLSEGCANCNDIS